MGLQDGKILLLIKLEMRSVERGICPIASSTMNELLEYYRRMHETAVYISTSGLKSDVFLDPDFLLRRENFGHSRTFKALQI